MKYSNRAITLSAAVMTSLSIGIAIGSAFSLPSANAASKSDFVLTGALRFPANMNEKLVSRIEDKEAGVICYTQGMAFSCLKK